MNKKQYIIVFCLAVALAWFILPIQSDTPPEQGLYGELVVLKYNEKTGEYDKEVVMNQKPSLAIYKVNNVEVSERDIIMTRAWLKLRAPDFSSRVSNMRFRVSSPCCEWGTEHDGTNGPVVPSSASWLQKELPRGEWVEIQLKFYDNQNIFELPPSEQPPDFPYESTYPDPSCSYREARNGGEYFLTDGHIFGPYELYDAGAGTYTVDITFELTSFQLANDPHTYTPSDFPETQFTYTVSYTIEKQTDDIEVQFNGDSSY